MNWLISYLQTFKMLIRQNNFAFGQFSYFLPYPSIIAVLCVSVERITEKTVA